MGLPTFKLEYIWLDGYKPEPNLRGKTKIVEKAPKSLEDLDLWGFDGSSTMQAEGHSSDCVLKPVGLYPDCTRKNAYIVMCEVLLPNGEPHPTNHRAGIIDDPDLWVGLEQEYFFWKDGKPLGFPSDGQPSIPQGPYYTGVGYKYMGDVARGIAEEHIDITREAGINLEGINAEVAKGQWEYQVFAKGARKICDDMWVSRFLLIRLAEKYGLDIELHCKPVKGDWNGSGMHLNFSTKFMREKGGKPYFESLMAMFDKMKNEHIAAYGPDNHLRLTGLHETQSIDKFNYGVANRGASIRIPHSFVKNDAYRGYLEDRRPNSQADPYKIVERLTQTLKLVPEA
ncbi:glutamine synthetase beta-grasp domain-containing protein [Planctomicrobium piriforme]|uniref:Glutamine synthetase n=1 Tax=Planctomicrobium piriforme TaxID=1576369 RepID=A0A1I3NP93_9PLAN|nr:glutamine synthetase beta-grasp domain-containing protein [Planctomicrobium piriforme]SFJ10596.1 glutamine synthetase [Planctomicrobium piriforme]